MDPRISEEEALYWRVVHLDTRHVEYFPTAEAARIRAFELEVYKAVSIRPPKYDVAM